MKVYATEQQVEGHKMYGLKILIFKFIFLRLVIYSVSGTFL